MDARALLRKWTGTSLSQVTLHSSPMHNSFSQSLRLRDYTNAPFEIFIVLFSVLPFLALAYFYPALPERIPLLLNLNGEVATWAEKSVLSVFRCH